MADHPDHDLADRLERIADELIEWAARWWDYQPEPVRPRFTLMQVIGDAARGGA